MINPAPKHPELITLTWEEFDAISMHQKHDLSDDELVKSTEASENAYDRAINPNAAPKEYHIPEKLRKDIENCLKFGCEGTLPNERELLSAVVEVIKKPVASKAEIRCRVCGELMTHHGEEQEQTYLIGESRLKRFENGGYWDALLQEIRLYPLHDKTNASSEKKIVYCPGHCLNYLTTACPHGNNVTKRICKKGKINKPSKQQIADAIKKLEMKLSTGMYESIEPEVYDAIALLREES